MVFSLERMQFANFVTKCSTFLYICIHVIIYTCNNNIIIIYITMI